MEFEKDKIKDLFSSKLESFEPEVPASIWGGLDQILSNQTPPSVEPSSSTNASAASSAGKASLMKTIAITIGMAAVVATSVLLLAPKDETIIPEDQTSIVTEKPEESILEENISDENEVEVTPKLAYRKPEANKVAKLVAEENVSVVEKAPEKKEQTTDSKPETENKPAIIESKVVEAETVLIAELPKFFTKDVSLGVTSDVGVLSNNISQQGGGLMFSRAHRSRVLTDDLAKENSEFQIEHRQPISFGLTISKNISSRVAIETGLIYTYLSSKLTSNSHYNVKENQYFNYLGIPLSVNYTFYELGKTKFYISLGGMVQKDINGRYESQMNFENSAVKDYLTQESSYLKNNIKQSNPQFSVRTRLGIAYPLYKKLYLYGTVGGAYYFDAGNEYRTIYSDKKTQLDLNLGIKFDF